MTDILRHVVDYGQKLLHVDEEVVSAHSTTYCGRKALEVTRKSPGLCTVSETLLLGTTDEFTV